MKIKRYIFSAIVLAVMTLVLAFALCGCSNGRIKVTCHEMQGAFAEELWIQDPETFQMTPPTRLGYDFLGCFDKLEGGTCVIDATGRLRMTPENNTVLWAHWSPRTYTFVFDPTEGQNVGSDTCPYVYDSRIDRFPIPVREGYDFAGWYCDMWRVSDAQGIPLPDAEQVRHLYYTFDEETASVSLRAEWTMRQLTVTLNYRDSAYANEVLVLPYGETLELSSLTSIDTGERAMRGWSLTENVSELLTEDLVLTDDIQLHAVWGAYTDTELYAHEKSYETVRVFENETYPLPTPERPGCEFLGWYTVDGAPVTELIYPDVEQRYLARWQAISYTVTYDGNGASFGHTEEQTERSADKLVPLTANGFHHMDYIFGGWNTAPDGSGTAYRDGETVAFIPGAEDGHVTLYAQWRTKIFHVMLDYANPSHSDAVVMENAPFTEMTVYLGKSYELPTPRCEYFTFLGWDIAGMLLTGESLWTLDAGEDGATVHVVAVWERTEKELTSTYVRDVEEPIHINEGQYDQFTCRVPSTLSPVMLEAYGYSSVQLTVTVSMAEVEDGYQHVMLYHDGSMFKDVILEHGPGHRDTSWYEHTVVVSVPTERLGSDGGVTVIFGAHGNASDEWLLGKTTYTFRVQ